MLGVNRVRVRESRAWKLGKIGVTSPVALRPLFDLGLGCLGLGNRDHDQVTAPLLRI